VIISHIIPGEYLHLSGEIVKFCALLLYGKIRHICIALSLEEYKGEKTMEDNITEGHVIYGVWASKYFFCCY